MCLGCLSSCRNELRIVHGEATARILVLGSGGVVDWRRGISYWRLGVERGLIVWWLEYDQL